MECYNRHARFYDRFVVNFNYGTLNAIMGPCKSGKTNLLKCLAGRINECIDPDSKLYTNDDIKPNVVYLDKNIDSNILYSLTINETLDYSFRFRNPNVPSKVRAGWIADLITMFELNEIQDIPLTYCTPEERVRTQLAMALASVNRPNLVFVDEPFDDVDVTGVDHVVILMKRLARYYSIAFVFTIGKIIDSDILTIFDKLYVLSRGGLCVYEGSIDHLSLFLRESDVTFVATISTPMERLMKVASKPNHITLRLATNAHTTRDDIVHLAEKFGILSIDGIRMERALVSWQNVFDLICRSILHKYRLYWKPISIYFALTISFTLILISAFSDHIGVPDACYNRTNGHLDPIGRLNIMDERLHEMDRSLMNQVARQPIDIIQRQHLIDDNVKFLFVIICGLTIFQISTSAHGLNEEVRVAINEHRNGWLNINSFFIVKNIVDLVVPTVNTTACALLSYFMTKQVCDCRRFTFFLLSLLTQVICSQSLGFTIGIISIFNNRYTNLMILISYIILIAFSGYLIPMAEIALWLKVFTNLSFMKMTYELTLISIYGLNRCDERGLVHSYVMDMFGIESYYTYWRNMLWIAAHIIAYRLIFWSILAYKVARQRHIIRPIHPGDNDSYYDDDSSTMNHSMKSR
ncbi:ABC protein, sub ABCG [Blomia tropicalis]|nr:ABC protein, sub ABCG [Blomia tropicalis]